MAKVIITVEDVNVTTKDGESQQARYHVSADPKFEDVEEFSAAQLLAISMVKAAHEFTGNLQKMREEAEELIKNQEDNDGTSPIIGAQ